MKSSSLARWAVLWAVDRARVAPSDQPGPDAHESCARRRAFAARLLARAGGQRRLILSDEVLGPKQSRAASLEPRSRLDHAKRPGHRRMLFGRRPAVEDVNAGDGFKPLDDDREPVAGLAPARVSRDRPGMRRQRPQAPRPAPADEVPPRPVAEGAVQGPPASTSRKAIKASLTSSGASSAMKWPY